MASGRRPLNLRFGGWHSYQEWAENGFMPKSPDDRTADRQAKPGPPAGRDPETPPEAPAAAGRGERRTPSAGVPVPPPPRDPPARLPSAYLPSAYLPSAAPRPPAQDDLYPMPPTPRRPDEPLIRPYILTGGRTNPRHDLDVHALVQTTERGRETTVSLPAEQESIRRICQDARSVAEVAALLKVPLGVARILIDDLEAKGLVTVTLPPREEDHSVELLTRVLEGLQRL